VRQIVCFCNISPKLVVLSQGIYELVNLKEPLKKKANLIYLPLFFLELFYYDKKVSSVIVASGCVNQY